MGFEQHANGIMHSILTATLPLVVMHSDTGW
jgi:hypothetical protein